MKKSNFEQLSDLEYKILIELHKNCRTNIEEIEKKLRYTVDKIFNNYEKYQTNIKNLINKLPKPEGDKIASQKILDIVRKMHV